jgi:hypothetical protein
VTTCDPFIENVCGRVNLRHADGCADEKIDASIMVDRQAVKRVRLEAPEQLGLLVDLEEPFVLDYFEDGSVLHELGVKPASFAIGIAPFVEDLAVHVDEMRGAPSVAVVEVNPGHGPLGVVDHHSTAITMLIGTGL